MPSDIFGLDLVYEKQVDRTWEESANYGYFAGGYAAPLTPTILSTVDRIDFSTETVSAPGKNLTQARNLLAAVSNSNYGYFAGGDNTGTIFLNTVCTFDRLDFSTETVAVPSAPSPKQLTQNRGGLAAVSNSNYGYFAGGAATGEVCTIDRLDFSTETVAVPPAPAPKQLTKARRSLSSVSNSNYGYFAGGIDLPTYYSTIDRLDFTTETVNDTGVYLSEEKYNSAGASSSDYGYFYKGSVVGPPVISCKLDRLDFSSETISSKFLPIALGRNSSASNFGYAYFAGSPAVSSFNRLDFRTETESTPASPLSQSRNNLTSVSGGSRINARKVRVGITTTGVPISSTYGYFAGGNTVSTIDRLEYSTETIQSPVINAKLTLPYRAEFAAVSNSNYGYFGGGVPSPNTSIDRLDFSNETTKISSANITQERRNLIAVSNSNYGYFGGGAFTYCTIDRLDFSNETVTGPPIHGINLTQARYSLAAVSNSNYGYFVGGIPSTARIDRLDFSNETISTGKNLPKTNDRFSSVSNADYGYFGGGYSPPGPPYILSTIDRFDFSTESVSPSIAYFSQSKMNLTGTSNSNYGYFGGGENPGTSPTSFSTIDRLDFTTETVTTPASVLTNEVDELTAVSN